jgi:hypothetical protein
MLAGYDSAGPRLVRSEGPGTENQRTFLGGLLAFREGRLADAITEFRTYEQMPGWGPNILGLPYVGYAEELLGNAGSAIAAYERYLTTPWPRRLEYPGGDEYHLGRIHERLGDLHEQRGDTVKAIYYYGKLVDLWKDADPELQPRVEAARRAIEALSPDR